MYVAQTGVVSYPNTAGAQEVRSGPGDHPGLSVQVDWNARVVECHDPSVRKWFRRRAPPTCRGKNGNTSTRYCIATTFG